MKIIDRLSATIPDIAYTLAGAVTAGFGLMSFLVPNKFIDGGVTGISLLIHELYHLNIAYVIIAANIPFVILGAFLLGRRFALRTLATVVLLGLCLLFIPYPVITSDKLIASIFGGFFLGLGVGLGMRGGCSLDGIEVLALYALKRSSFTISEIILALNAIIFLVAAMFFGLEIALYAMLTYYVATRTIDYVIEGLEEYTSVTIISGQSDVIKRKLAVELGLGITVYKGERGFLKDSFEVSQDCDIVFTVVTRLEVRRLTNTVRQIDHKAFIFTNTIKEAAGGVLRRKAGHNH
ncbi:MAG: YitT family protein [Lentisphaerae bacterium]|nr:YitT family protein [Lentisphaerota bacterium]